MGPPSSCGVTTLWGSRHLPLQPDSARCACRGAETGVAHHVWSTWGLAPRAQGTRLRTQWRQGHSMSPPEKPTAARLHAVGAGDLDVMLVATAPAEGGDQVVVQELACTPRSSSAGPQAPTRPLTRPQAAALPVTSVRTVA